MSLSQILADAIYTAAVAEDGVFVDASGKSHDVRVVPTYSSGTMLGEADVGLRALATSFTVRKESISLRPTGGEKLVVDGTTYCVDGQALDLNPAEWGLNVIT